MWSRRVPAAVLAVALLFSGSAQAQSYVRPDCQGAVAPAANRYDTAEHERWYKRFWTGTCDHLTLCVPGGPNWNEIVGKLLVKGGASERGALLPKACRLGQLIGLEWSRERNVRKITTADLKVFSAMLEATGDTLKGVDRVDAAARLKLGVR
ncbi:hypothetical protein [Caulobacter sp.]|uniref:hypothetical protein n=1 Tax=Caulobacter sp. TaxID=78 RepID=UPI002B483FBC|nr:hypothetical protein [Caulobacter sp.]HJV41219.1 hypothetical protein [Caulobacter sp.]